MIIGQAPGRRRERGRAVTSDLDPLCPWVVEFGVGRAGGLEGRGEARTGV